MRALIFPNRDAVKCYQNKVFIISYHLVLPYGLWFESYLGPELQGLGLMSSPSLKCMPCLYPPPPPTTHNHTETFLTFKILAHNAYFLTNLVCTLVSDARLFIYFQQKKQHLFFNYLSQHCNRNNPRLSQITSLTFLG